MMSQRVYVAFDGAEEAPIAVCSTPEKAWEILSKKDPTNEHQWVYEVVLDEPITEWKQAGVKP